jgi:hypothetical protein
VNVGLGAVRFEHHNRFLGPRHLKRYLATPYTGITTMNRCHFTNACTLMAVGVVATISFGVTSQAANPSLAPFEFHRQGAASPEAAATALFRGVATESPRHFVQHARDFERTEYDRQSLRRFSMNRIDDEASSFKNSFEQENERCECLILRTGRNAAIDGKIGKELVDVLT